MQFGPRKIEGTPDSIFSEYIKRIQAKLSESHPPGSIELQDAYETLLAVIAAENGIKRDTPSIQKESTNPENPDSPSPDLLLRLREIKDIDELRLKIKKPTENGLKYITGTKEIDGINYEFFALNKEHMEAIFYAFMTQLQLKKTQALIDQKIDQKLKKPIVTKRDLMLLKIDLMLLRDQLRIYLENAEQHNKTLEEHIESIESYNIDKESKAFFKAALRQHQYEGKVKITNAYIEQIGRLEAASQQSEFLSEQVSEELSKSFPAEFEVLESLESVNDIKNEFYRGHALLKKAEAYENVYQYLIKYKAQYTSSFDKDTKLEEMNDHINVLRQEGYATIARAVSNAIKMRQYVAPVATAISTVSMDFADLAFNQIIDVSLPVGHAGVFVRSTDKFRQALTEFREGNKRATRIASFHDDVFAKVGDYSAVEMQLGFQLCYQAYVSEEKNVSKQASAMHYATAEMGLSGMGFLSSPLMLSILCAGAIAGSAGTLAIPLAVTASIGLVIAKYKQADQQNKKNAFKVALESYLIENDYGNSDEGRLLALYFMIKKEKLYGEKLKLSQSKLGTNQKNDSGEAEQGVSSLENVTANSWLRMNIFSVFCQNVVGMPPELLIENMEKLIVSNFELNPGLKATWNEFNDLLEKEYEMIGDMQNRDDPKSALPKASIHAPSAESTQDSRPPTVCFGYNTLANMKNANQPRNLQKRTTFVEGLAVFRAKENKKAYELFLNESQQLKLQYPNEAKSIQNTQDTISRTYHEMTQIQSKPGDPKDMENQEKAQKQKQKKFDNALADAFSKLNSIKGKEQTKTSTTKRRLS